MRNPLYTKAWIYFSVIDENGGDIWSLAFLNGTPLDPCSEFIRSLSSMPSIQILSLSATSDANSQKMVPGKMSELMSQSGGHSGQGVHLFSCLCCDLLSLSLSLWC